MNKLPTEIKIKIFEYLNDYDLVILTNFPSLKLICYDCLYRRNFLRTYSSNDQILPVWFRFGTDGLKIIQ